MFRLAIAILLVLLFAPAPASPISFSVTPMNAELTAHPGADVTGVVTVVQPAVDADGHPVIEPLRLRVTAVDWTLGRDGAPQFFPAGTRPDGAASWLQANPTETDVPPGGSCQVRYTFRVPADAQGAYHAMLLFETAPRPFQAYGSGMQVRGRIGCALYVQVGPQVRRVRVTAFAAAPQKTTLTLQNTGNSLVRLKGVCRFSDAGGKTVRAVDIPSVVLLPGRDGLRDLTLETKGLPPGDYDATALIDYGGDALLGARTHVHVP